MGVDLAHPGTAHSAAMAGSFTPTRDEEENRLYESDDECFRTLSKLTTVIDHHPRVITLGIEFQLDF